jgi:hypothetical protein
MNARPAAVAPADMPTTFHGQDGRYTFSVLDGLVELIVDHVRRERYDLVGEIEIRCFIPGVRTYGKRSTLMSTKVNLSSARARQDLARLAATAARVADLDWAGHLEDFVQRIWAEERQGTPAVPLHEIPRPTADATIEAFGLQLLRDHPQLMFATGGTAKSLLSGALVGELGRKGVRTLLLDWEMDGGEQRLRADALGLPPTIWYRRCDQPLSLLADSIRRDVLEHEIGFLLIDSVAPACDGDAIEAAVAIDFFKAWRRIGRGGLAIAHTRAEDGEQRPFGSVFWHNLARSTWFLKRVNESGRPNVITLGVYHRKANFGPLRPPFGIELQLDGPDNLLEMVTVRRTNIADVAELATGLPLWQRISHTLRQGSKTIKEIAEELDAKQDTVKKALARDNGRAFTLITKTEDGVQRWGLLDRRTA